MNRIGINLWNWTALLDDSSAALVEHAASLGFSAVELPMSVPVPGNLGALRDTIGRLGLEVTLCASMTGGRDLSSEDAGIRESTATYLRGCVDTAHTLGAKVLAGPIYAGGGKRHHLEQDARRAEWERAVEGIAALGRYAGEKGVRLGVEAVNRYRTSVVNTTSQALKMVRDIGLEQVGILFDTYQSCIEDEDVCGALEEVLKAGKLFHFHACANHRGAPGTGHLPWERILGLLGRYGYEGHITMETFCPGALDAGWVPLAESQDALALTGLRYLRQKLT